MKKIEVVKSNEVEVKPFIPDAFLRDEANSGSMEKVTKKELKSLAKKLGMNCSDAQLECTKKLITAYLAKR